MLRLPTDPLAERRRARLGGLAVALLAALVLAPSAGAEPTAGTFALDTELYRGMEAAFGEVRVEEDGAGGLHVTVSLDPAVAGDEARVKHVLLSLDPLPEGLEAVPDDADAHRVMVRRQRHVWHSMGADFGAVVSVWPRHDRHRRHPWRWWRRPEPIQTFGFTLVADAPLVLDDVLGMRATWRDDVTQIGVHAHGLDLGRRHHGAGMLGGLFEPDAEPEPDPDDGPPGGTPPPDDGTIPPGCFGQVDPVTGEVISIFCP
jgi:hypothetical protein